MNICVIGSGYVGLVVGAAFAETGNRVISVDADAKKIEHLNAGQIPIYEPGLDDLVRRNHKEGRLVFSTDLKSGVEASSVIFITVGTPSKEGGQVDLKFVLGVAENIGRVMNGAKTIVIKSTTPCGTTEKVSQVLAAHTQHPFDVVSNPEFLKEGVALEDFMKPNRVVVGLKNEKLKPLFERLYGPFLRTGKPLLFMSPASAEMTKYAANGLLALRISYMNEVANLCDALGADVFDVRKGVGSDERIGHAFLFPGVGYGGSCFPKDVDALIHTAKETGLGLRTLQASAEVNRDQQGLLARKIEKCFVQRGETLSGKVIGIWGLAFKPRTDDMREAPALRIIADLLRAGASVRAFDPVANAKAKIVFEEMGLKVNVVSNAYDAAKGAHALAIVTEWNEFRLPDLLKLKELMVGHHIFDGRNILDPKEVTSLGFTYEGIGRRA